MGHTYSCHECTNVATLCYTIDVPETINTSFENSKYKQWRGISQYLSHNTIRLTQFRCKNHEIPLSSISKECRISVKKQECFRGK